MNINELRAFAGEYLGKEVEFYSKGEWVKGILDVVDANSGTNYPFESRDRINGDLWHTDARPPQPRQMRDMTAQELAGKWLVCQYWTCGEICKETKVYKSLVTNIDENTIHMPHLDNKWFPVSELIKLCWKVNDKPSLDGAQDLRVEVSGE